ncbi:MAG: hypothetical protein AAF430_10270 [Myxococcota bacterium]
MSEPEHDQQSLEAKQRDADAASGDEEDDDEVSSPFDHPAFLPVLLWGASVWFGYDGWFSETIEAVNFNRYGFFFLVGFAIYFTVSETMRIPFLLPGLWAVFALWLTGFTLFGAEDAWWREDSDDLLTSASFNRMGAIGCAILAAYFAFSEWRSGGGDDEAPA